MPISLEQFVARLAETRLISLGEIEAFRNSLPADKLSRDDCQAFVNELVRQEKLTPYQATAVFRRNVRCFFVGPYVILDLIHQDGLRTIFKASQRVLKRNVALVLLSPEAIKSRDAVVDFHREIEAISRLTHPNIVAALDADEVQGAPFLVMEFVDGPDLWTHVRENGPLALESAVDYVIQAANGLQFAHDQGQLHARLNPKCLLVDRRGIVKIRNLGIQRPESAVLAALSIERLARRSANITIDCMAPEVAASPNSADARSDIYSLGCILFYLLTGRRIFPGDSVAATIVAHREQPVPTLCGLRADVSATLDAVFQKMVAKRPIDRYQSMTEVICELDASLGA